MGDHLRYAIGADTSSFDAARRKIESGASATAGVLNRTFGKVNSGVDAFRAGLARLGPALAAAGIGIGLAEIASTLKDIADIGDVADKIGLTTESLQELRFAAARTGSDVAALDTGMAIFAKNLSEAASGKVDMFSRVLEANGVSLRNADGSLRTQMEVLADYADLVRNAATGQDKLNLTTIAFGSAGADLVGMLSRGAAGLSDMATEAHNLGVVIGSDTIDAARQMDDKYSEVIARLSALWKRFVVEVVTGASQIATAIGASSTAFGGGSLVGKSVDELIAARDKLTERIGEYSARGRDSILGGLIADSDADNVARLTARLAEVNDEIAQMRVNTASGSGGGPLAGSMEELRAILAAAQQAATIIPGSDSNRGSGGGSRGSAISEIERQREAIRKLIEDLQFEAEVEGMTAEQREIATELRRAGAEAAELDRQNIIRAIEAKYRLRDANKEVLDSEERLRDMTEEWADRLFDVFGQIMDGTFDAKKALAGLLLELAKAMLLGKGLFAGLFGGSSGGALTSILSALLGGIAGKATGGPVAGGTPYIVGEQGPELFVPKMAGTIVPNGAFGGQSRVAIDVQPSELFAVRVRQVSGDVTDEKLKARDASSPARVTAAIREARTRNMLR